MNLFYKRHLALFCSIFAVVSIGGCFLYSQQKVIAGVTLLLLSIPIALFSLFVKQHRASFFKCLLCILFAAAALLESYVAIDRKHDTLSPYLDQTVETEIIIIGKNKISDFYSSFDILLDLDGKKHNALLTCEYKGNFSVGDILCGEVSVTGIEASQENPTYYFSKGIYITAQSTEDSLTVIAQGYSNNQMKLRALNTFLSRIYDDKIGGEASDLIAAISLGNKSMLESNILRDFRRAGLSHILAISGMHLSVIMMALDWLFRHLGIRKSFRCVLIFLIAFFYLSLTGFSLSTVRAFIMMSLVYLAFLFRSNNDAVTSLFASLFLILVISPNAVWDVGLWMSFLAVLGLLTANYFIEKISKKFYESKCKKIITKAILYLLSATLITLFANIFVCFPLWLYFGELSLVAVISNLAVTPLISLILFGAPFLLLAQLISPLSFIVLLLAVPLRFIANLVITIIEQISNWESITVSLRYPFAGYIIIPCFFLLLLTLILPLRHKIWIPLIPTVAALLFIGCFFLHNQQNEDHLAVDYLSFGESEMLLLKSVDDAVICDISTGGNSHLYQTILTAEEEKFATEISAVILTHYHTYHVNTFSRNASSSKIRKLYLPIPQTLDEYHLMCSLIDAAGKAKTAVILYDRDEDFSPMDGVTVNLSAITYLKRSTHPTFALSVSAHDQTLTYIAESAHESNTLHDTIDKRIHESEYIILGTHGPITKTDFQYSTNSSSYVFVSNSTVLSHFYPQKDGNIVIGSTKVQIKLG